jgi:hypothetical protein
VRGNVIETVYFQDIAEARVYALKNEREDPDENSDKHVQTYIKYVVETYMLEWGVPVDFNKMTTIYIGRIEMKPDTVLTADMIRAEINYFNQGFQQCANSAEWGSICREIKKLEDMLASLS